MSAPAARKAVLVLTNTEDGTADPGIHHLQERQIPVIRMDPGDFPVAMTIEAELAGDSWKGSVHDTFRELDLGSVRSVYYRRPSQFTLSEGMSGPEQRWAYREARMGFGGVLLALNCPWINRPERMSAAEYKPVQLTTAVRCGLTVPRTLITNVPEQAAAWAEALPGPAIYKSLGGAIHVEEGKTRIIYANQIKNLDELREPSLSSTAHCFQQWVDKDREARVTIIGDEMFAVMIHTTSESGHIDWRSDYDSHQYEVVETPTEVQEGLKRYMDAFGLIYGAADFVVSRNGVWTLLEVNPNGEWFWLAEACDLPVARSLAGLLEKGQR